MAGFLPPDRDVAGIIGFFLAGDNFTPTFLYILWDGTAPPSFYTIINAVNKPLLILGQICVL